MEKLVEPVNIDEFHEQFNNDPVAYAYYRLGMAVEKDSKLTKEQRELRDFELIYSAFKLGLIDGKFAEQTRLRNSGVL